MALKPLTELTYHHTVCKPVIIDTPLIYRDMSHDFLLIPIFVLVISSFSQPFPISLSGARFPWVPVDLPGHRLRNGQAAAEVGPLRASAAGLPQRSAGPTGGRPLGLWPLGALGATAVVGPMDPKKPQSWAKIEWFGGS